MCHRRVRRLAQQRPLVLTFPICHLPPPLEPLILPVVRHPQTTHPMIIMMQETMMEMTVPAKLVHFEMNKPHQSWTQNLRVICEY